MHDAGGIGVRAMQSADDCGFAALRVQANVESVGIAAVRKDGHVRVGHAQLLIFLHYKDDFIFTFAFYSNKARILFRMIILDQILILFCSYLRKMFQGNKLSSALQPPNQTNNEILKQFYSLHYPARKQSGPDYKKMRSNSVMAVSEHYDPEIETEKQAIKRKKSKAQKGLHHQHNLSKHKAHKVKEQKQQPFSFKRMLSASEERKFASEYFASCPSKYLGTLDELSNRNTNIKNAVQKYKDEKMKISKVLISQKQSEDTKMDYLLLKRKEIQDEKNTQIKAIYQQFFKKEYEEMYGEDAFNQFSTRINETVSLFRTKIFSK